MGFWQWLVVGLCVLGNVIDGFELTVMGFALPQLPDGFATTSQKGWLASAGLIGMAVGAIFMAPFADRVGRRRIIILASGLSAFAMALTAMAPDFWTMFMLRVATGVGVGAVSSLTIIIAQEYSSLRNRNLSTGIVFTGFAVGAFVAGSVGLILLDALGGAWQGLFITGSVVSFIGLVLMILLLPESLAYMVAQQNEDSFKKIAAIAKKLKLEGVDPRERYVESTNSEVNPGGSEPDQTPFSSRYISRTLMLIVGYTALTAAYYFITNWTPQLISDATGDVRSGTMVGTIITFGGILGAIMFGILGIRVFATKLAWIMIVVALVALVTFALTVEGSVAFVAAGLLGMGAYAALSSYMASAPPLYPVLVRGKAVGYLYGFSRLGSIAAPVAAGYLLLVVSGFALYVAAAALLLISGIFAFALWVKTKSVFLLERQGATDAHVMEASLNGSDASVESHRNLADKID